MDEAVVLIVDDEAAHRRALCRALAGVATLRAAADGAEALEAASDGRVWLVISDQRMHGMSGVELLSEVRARHPDTILILLTAFADMAALQDAVNRTGIYHYFEKPWSVFELRQVVVRGLERFFAERQRQGLVEDLRRSCLILRKEAEYKNRLLTVLAHELGTPVHVLVNGVRLLQDFPMGSDARRWVATLRRAGDRLARGISQMQRASVTGRDDLSIRLRPVDLTDVAGEAMRALRSASIGRSLDLEERHAAPSLWVAGDRSWLDQLVWNLLTNAVRFTPDGGRVVLETESDGDTAALVVRDTGVGIAEHLREELFVPFSAAAGDPVLHGSGWLDFGARGLGLGLAITKRIVDALGGSIDVHSTLGEGTTCIVKLREAGGPESLRRTVPERDGEL